MADMTMSQDDWADFLETGDATLHYQVLGLTVTVKNFDPERLDMKAFQKACIDIARAVYVKAP